MSSADLKNIFGSIPTVSRGLPLHLGMDRKNNKKIVFCTGGIVVIRDMENLLDSDVYVEHQHPATVARLSPSGFYMASADTAGKVRVWDMVNKTHILKIEIQALGGKINDMEWSDDSKRLIAVGEGRESYGKAFMFDSGSSVGDIQGHTKFLNSCDFKQTRPYRVATGGEDFKTNFFEGPPFKLTKTLPEATRFVNVVRFSPDGAKLFTGGLDKIGHFYDGKTGDHLGQIAHEAGIYSASWSADSKQILTASGDKTCKIWDATTFACVQTFTFGSSLEDQQLGCLWSGNHLISVNLLGHVQFLDQSAPTKPKRVLYGHKQSITSLAFDAEANQIYTSDGAAIVVRWDLATGNTALVEDKGHTNQVNRVRVAGDSLVTASMDDHVRVSSKAQMKWGTAALALEGNVFDLAVASANSGVQVAITNKKVVVIKAGQVASTLTASYEPSSVALSPDASLVSVGSEKGEVREYKVGADGSLAESGKYEGHAGHRVTSIAYSPDGKSIVSCDASRAILVFAVGSGATPTIDGLKYHNGKPVTVAWAPGSKYFATGGVDASIYIWNVNAIANRIHVKDAHKGGVNELVWINETTLASVGADCLLKTWTVKWA